MQSGTAQWRLDADVSELTGFAQPENCGEIVGVVSNFLQLNKYYLECTISRALQNINKQGAT
jgi:hypothetical protein